VSFVTAPRPKEGGGRRASLRRGDGEVPPFTIGINYPRKNFFAAATMCTATVAFSTVGSPVNEGHLHASQAADAVCTPAYVKGQLFRHRHPQGTEAMGG
jgi:hypothetical protein